VSAPLLELRSARVDAGGVPAIDGLSLATTERKVLVLGAARALFEAASGVRAPAHGEVLVLGEAATRALSAGRVASVPLDLAAPPSWTAREYVEWSARLAGHGRRAARAMAAQSLSEMRVASLADTKLARAEAHARRAVFAAGALATGAEVLLLEDPLAALPDDTARNLGKLLTQALAGRAWIVFAGRMPLVSPLALAADEALVVSGSELAAQGQPAEIAALDRSFALRLLGAADAFAARVAARGARVARAHGMELVIELGPLTTTDVVALAEEAGAVIVELTPLARTFQ
jgi:ABC-type cobalamin/Fe3+-siderophores transport system ATPase subunit